MELNEVKSILKEDCEIFKQLKKEHKKLLMHVNGIGVADYLDSIQNYENSDQLELRRKYAKSNKALFSAILRPIDKIFSAKGGGRSYELSPNKIKDFKSVLSDVVDDLSLQKWIETYWKDKFITDPNGLIVIEHDGQDAYPTYKSINSIRKYQINGQSVDWIVFEPVKVKVNNTDVYYVRVYDDTEDKMYKYTGNNIDSLIEIEDETYGNPWGKVPAILISNITDTLNGYKRSPIYEELELGDEYLLQASIKSIYKFKQGYPITWMYKTACKTCMGTRELNGSTCPTCKGTGYDLNRDVSDIKLIDPPEHSDEPTLTDVAGHIQPDLATWVQMNDELQLLRSAMEFSHWGTFFVREKEKTATEVFVNIQPVNERLNMYADSAELIETLVTNFLGEYYYGSAYKGSSIHYGRRYLIETPDQLIKQYIEGREKKLSPTLLNYLLIQYYQTEFSNDFASQMRFINMLKIEPFPHNSIGDVLSMDISEDDKKAKIYFGEWERTLSEDDQTKTLEELKKSFIKYLKSKKYEKPGTFVQ